MSYKTEQEFFWAGNFGNEYIQRNQSEKLLASNINFFSNALSRTRGIKSFIEFGANVGMNIKALTTILPTIEGDAVEINQEAAKRLACLIPAHRVHNKSILNFEPQRSWDLVFTKGLLIHVNPDELPRIYETMFRSTSRYILLAEYYNPMPVAITYRGHENKLFKRDFAGELMDLYEEIQLVDYGFAYHRDVNFPQDDLSWFLLEKLSNRSD